jgi:hypothetical protein
MVTRRISKQPVEVRGKDSRAGACGSPLEAKPLATVQAEGRLQPHTPGWLRPSGRLEHGLERPRPARNEEQLSASLYRAVHYAAAAPGRNWINTTPSPAFNADLKRFIESDNSASPYEVLVLKRGAHEEPPELISNGQYTLGDRVFARFIYGGSESDTDVRSGIVWNIRAGNESYPKGLVNFLLNGKEGDAPFFVTAWHSSSLDVRVVASAPDEGDAESFLQSWKGGG